MASNDPRERSAIARIGAHTLHSMYDSRELTHPARSASEKALNARLLTEIDEREPGLPPGERSRRLEHARSAHFTRMARKAAKTRRRKAGLGKYEAPAATEETAS